MYGVYVFLEKLGCRWFAAGVICTPRRGYRRTEERPAKRAFEYREQCFSEAADRD